MMKTMFRNFLLWSVLCIFIPFATAQSTQTPVVAGGQSSGTVPFELINNHVYVHVLLNGRWKYWFVLDTGGFNLLTANAARMLLADASPSHAGGTRARVQEVFPRRVESSSIQIDGLPLRNQSFVVSLQHDFEAVEGVVPFGGILGYEFFHQYVVGIDYESHRLTLAVSNEFRPTSKGIILPLKALDPPEIMARIDGVEGKFSIDTGDRRSLALYEGFARHYHMRDKHPPQVRALTGWGLSGPVWSDLSRAQSFQVGDLKILRPLIEYDLPGRAVIPGHAFSRYAGNIGGGLLQQFNVTFDYGRRLLTLERNSTYGKPITWDRSGMWINQDGPAFKIVDVTQGGPAAHAGLRIGDRIMAVDGQEAAQLSLPAVRQRFRSDSVGTLVRLSIMSKTGRKRDVTLTLKDLV